MTVRSGTTISSISVVIPLLDEEENITPLYKQLSHVLEGLGCPWETIFVDDGSRDRTFEVLAVLARQDQRVHAIRFRRNFGQTAAIAAGLARARGSVIITMDGDLQNDPVDIPRLLNELERGYDLVNGWRADRKDAFLTRRLPSTIANWVISKTTGVRLHDFGCTLKAIRREIATELKLYGEMHRFIPALASQVGARILEIPVQHHPRRFGRSKYGIARIVRVLLDLMTVKFLSEYSTRPGHFFGLLGLLALIGGSTLTATLGVLRAFFGVPLADRPILLLGILLMIVGLQFVTVGLVSEMLSRIYHESQQKPTYAIRESVGNFTREWPDTSRNEGTST